MSLVKLTEDKFERFTLITNPSRTFASSSSGITGSVSLFARENRTVKEADPLFSDSTPFDDAAGVNFELKSAQTAAASGSTNINALVELYMTGVESEPLSSRNSVVTSIERFTPGFTIDKAAMKKRAVVKHLMPYYRNRYPRAHYAYTNYHSLNFFTASSVPSDSVLIYPNTASTAGVRDYTPTGSFTLDFQINPRYTTDSETDEFTAGTIFHISSTIAVSLVTGSAVGSDGKPTGYRLLLQLSHSADTPPSEVDLTVANNARSFPNDLTFLSSDNSLERNRWHHAVIRWGSNTINAGTGSFVIDNTIKGEFNVPSSSIASTQSPALFVGNYFDSPGVANTATHEERFFNLTAATAEGVTDFVDAVPDPTSFSFAHPLNAEIHDLKLYKTYRTLLQGLTSSIQGPENLNNLLFYLPVFFVRETRQRTILRTPFSTTASVETVDPFNVEFAFNVGGHILNLEGFVREFVKGEYPRLHSLTASATTSGVVSGQAADVYMYEDPFIVKRNLTALPNDNGNFIPNFRLLLSGTVTPTVVTGTATDKFANDLGSLDLQLISLKGLLDDSILQTSVTGTLEDEILGASPDDPSQNPGVVPTVFQRTGDSDSNQVVFFDVPSLFFGRRILPDTFSMTDSNLSGSDGKVSVTLKDNGEGSLYRADSLGNHAKWNSVGNVFYNEGLVLVKSPNMPFFGKDQHELTFQGERNIYTMKVNVIAPAAAINSSSNPTFTSLSASLNANDEESDFVYITGITLHDENLNVVARTNLAQPVIKRSADKILFRVRLDW